MSEIFQHHASTTRLERPAAFNSQKPRGVFEIQPSNELTTQVAALTQKLDQLIHVLEIYAKSILLCICL